MNVIEKLISYYSWKAELFEIKGITKGVYRGHSLPV